MVRASYVPDAGHIVKVDLDPRTGHEQGGWRPALVLSPGSYNARTGLAIVVPITNQVKGYPFEVPLPEQNRISRAKITGVVLSDAVKNVDWRARKAKYADTVSAGVLDAVRERLALLLGLTQG
jgi:mRNA interferase MazF